MFSVLRFFANPDPQNANQLLSRTLGKIAFIAKDYRGFKPNAGEFWLSDVTTEIRAGQVGGCFLVEPYAKVDYEDLVTLTPASCTVNPVFPGILVADPVCLETPDANTIPWIMSKRHKAQLLTGNTVAVIVNLGGRWWRRVP